ncbi:VirD4-like conjugal transfer protein, CD1115 family [Siminovitchia sediminis]|uniref:VirD4-like conjugal transfer protein, CD1115 family n=1 Tax=Siminovitchia sediminis TaxID=1274353 RepID=A0ABW4KMV2_9BACI
MQNKQLLERLTSPKAIFLFAIGFLIVSFFLANFVLAFLQKLLLAIEQFAKDPENVGFSIPWESFLHFQTDVLWFYAGFYLIVGIGLIKFLFNIRMNYQSLNKGQHGTSEFEKVKALKKQYKMIPAAKEEYDGNGGVIISGLQEKYRPYRLLIDEGPIHTMVIGITRSGKGETFVFPMLDVLSRAKNKPSLVVNDPKGELAAASYDTLIKRGYEVHVFNLIQQSMGMGFNPLHLVVDAWKTGNPSLAQQYANSVAYSLYHDPNAKDPFWSNSAKSLVTAIILALTEDAIATGKEEKVNMYSVANFLSTKGGDNDEEGNNALDLFFRAREDNNPARMMYATSNFAAGNTRASIFSTAMDKLQIFALEPNAKLTSYNSMNLTDVGFGDKPVAVFMVTPDFDESNHVLASIFVSQLYRVNAEKATMSPSGKLKRQVHFLLDEFGNMPTVEGMSGMVTVGAGRGFRFHLIVQAYSQIKSRYGDEADTIIGNCSNQIYILTKDEQTAKQFSSLIGTKTITDVSRNGKLLSSDKSHSESVKERPLMMPDELMQLKEGQSVVVRANKRQDNKRRKIVPKPIFNKDVTSHKFRWEYLADDFDNSRSILELPIMSTTYHDLNLSQMVFTSKNEQEQFVRMVDAMGRDDFLKLKTDLRKVFIACGETFKYEDEIDKWSFLHLLSYLTYETSLSGPIIYKIYKSLSQCLPDAVLEKWDQKIREAREKQEQKRREQEESIEETGEPLELDEKEALRKQVKGAV